jgi:hypothetical protein
MELGPVIDSTQACRHVNASRADVYRALLDPDAITRSGRRQDPAVPVNSGV